jgi:tetratricopeptide (TPR) repeat protein
MAIRLLTICSISLIAFSNTCLADLDRDLQECMTLIEEHKAKQAQNACQHLIDSDELSDEVLAVAYANVGTAYYLMKDYSSAIAKYDKAIELNPLDASAYFMRGQSYFFQHQSAKAVDNYSRAIEIRPDDWQSFSARGHAYFVLGDFQKAEDDFSAAIHFMPGNAIDYSGRAAVRLEMGKLDAALEDVAIAISIDPALVHAYRVRGLINIQKGQPLVALSDFDRTIEVRPDYFLGYYLRAKTLLHLGRFDQALADFEKASSMMPNDKDILVGAGKALFLLGRYEEAITKLEYTDEEDMLSHLYLALARESAGEAGFGLLKESIKNFDLTKWPGPLAEYFVGSGDRNDVEYFARAGEIGQPMHRACEASFLFGEQARVLGKNHDATAQFEKALELCARDSDYYVASSARLDH